MHLLKFEVTLFKALAHPLRLKILKKLCVNELCVCDLNEDAFFSQSNISQHLKVLRNAQLVEQRKDGLNVYYCVKDKKLIEIINLADEVIVENIKRMEEVLKD